MLIQSHKSFMSTLVLGLYASTLAFASTGAPQAAQVQAQVNDSQERALLTSLIALQGQAASSADYKAQALSQISQYDKTAPGAGRTDRILMAMTEMGMSTPNQAAETKSLIESTVADQYAAHPEMNQAQLEQYTAQVTMSQLQRNFLGAQFSGCMAMGIGAGAILAGAILGDVYANSLTQTATTSSSTGSEDGTWNSTSENGSTTTQTSTTVKAGTETTTVTTTNTREQNMLYAVSGIMYGVSAAMVIYMMATSDGGLCN